MIREKAYFPVVYMFVLTAFFSTILIGFTRVTSRRVEVNERLAFERAVLSVLPDLYDENSSGLEIHRKFTDSITEPDDSSGTAYTFRKNGKIVAYVVPVSGQGFWAPIRGVIGIKADRKTITGAAFYQQNETPGLGAEIARPAFTKQFAGREISTGDMPINIKRPGTELGESDVHAVTGATQTSTRLEKLINDGLSQWLTQMKDKGGEQ